MKTLISTYYSDNEMRTALVYKNDDESLSLYEVVVMDSYFGSEKTMPFNNLGQAEDYAEDWVL